MKGPVSEACLAFIRWGKGGGGEGELQHLAILPLHCNFILFIKFSLLPKNPYMAVWIVNFFSRQQRVIADLPFAYQ